MFQTASDSFLFLFIAARDKRGELNDILARASQFCCRAFKKNESIYKKSLHAARGSRKVNNCKSAMSNILSN